MVTMTSREFNQAVSLAKKEAALGPVIVTSRGEPRHVLLTYQGFCELAGKRTTLAGAFATMPDTGDTEVAFPRVNDLPRTAVFD